MSIETTVLNLRSIQEECDFQQFEEILESFDLRFDEFTMLLKDTGFAAE